MQFYFDATPFPEYGYLEEEYGLLFAFVLKQLGITENYELDASLVDEDTIQQINREYRHIDKVTDVISFAFNDDQSELGQILGDIPKLLGEIFICIPRALAQAAEIGNSPKRELRFLFVHGLLHLLGYDHMKKEDEEIMFPLQEKLLQAFEEAHP